MIVVGRIVLACGLLLMSHLLHAQNCACTIADVVNNSVESCEVTIGNEVIVQNAVEFRQAISQANAAGGNMTILIADGTYEVASTAWYPYITASNLVIRSQSGNRDAVILTGGGMRSVAPQTENGLSVVGNNVMIADLTIRDVGNHGISTQGDSMFIHNVRIQNTFEQMLKGTSAGDGADQALVQCSLFEYPGGIGPQFYIGGLDIHEGEDWVVRDNVFRNISSPSGSLAEHAVHFWDFSANNVVERNWIINCDRGIGFGLGSSPNMGGIIRNNMIYNDGSNQFDDVGIGLESSPNTRVYNNSIYIQYPNAIEYRFAETQHVEIANNLTNQLIRSRNGGLANLNNNYIQADPTWFIDISAGDLHLAHLVNDVVDQGADVSIYVWDDFDQLSRPPEAMDIGAHEFGGAVSTFEAAASTSHLLVYPNPTSADLMIECDDDKIAQIELWSNLGKCVYRNLIVHPLRNVSVKIGHLSPNVYVCRVYLLSGTYETIPVLILGE